MADLKMLISKLATFLPSIAAFGYLSTEQVRQKLRVPHQRFDEGTLKTWPEKM